ncbi:MAG: DUF3096 domain-containing protein [Actinomycetota bacterium]
MLAQRGGDVAVRFTLDGVVALLAGILILIMPKLLNYIVAAYLIYVGAVQLFDIRI